MTNRVRVIVSIATFNQKPWLLQRAIESVLNQDYADLMLVVINDGGVPPNLNRYGSSLVSLNVTRNYGHFFAHSIVHAAIGNSSGTSWKPQDSDDWAEKGSISLLAQNLRGGAVIGAHWRHLGSGERVLLKPRRTLINHPFPALDVPKLRRRFFTMERWSTSPRILTLPWAWASGNRVSGASWCAGLYRMDRIALAGGLHPGFFVGYDSFFLRMLARTGQIFTIKAPVYNVNKANPSSLTTARTTGLFSEIRRQSLWNKVELMGNVRKSGDTSASIRSDVPNMLLEQVAFWSDELKRHCGDLR